MAPRRRAASIIVLGLLTLGAAVLPALAAERPEVGETIIKRGRIASDLYAFGGGVDVGADVNGDLIAGGGLVTISHRVQGDLIVGAGSVTVGGLVEKGVRAAGGSITIAPEAVVSGSAQLVGGEVRVAGIIGRKLRVAGAVVVLAGEVAGNVEVVAQEIEVLPTARIKGKLVYWSPRPARIDPQATISGRITHNLPELPSRIARTGTALVTVSRTSFMAGLTVIAVALFLAFPRFTVLASRTVGTDPLKSLGIGLLLFAAIPVLAILIMITILGIPLGLLIFLGFSIALLLGFVLVAFYLGDVGAQAFMGRRSRERVVRVAFLILALGILLLARQIPVIGAVLIVITVILGLGAMSLYGWRRRADLGLEGSG